MVSEGQTDTELATNGASVMSSIVDLNDLASPGNFTRCANSLNDCYHNHVKTL